MKKKIIVIIGFLWVNSFHSQAQTALAKAEKFWKDNNANEATKYIDEALQDSKFAALPKTWFIKGQIQEFYALNDSVIKNALSEKWVLEALTHYQKARSLDAKFGDTYVVPQTKSMFAKFINKGVALHAQRDYATALRCFEQAQQIDKTDKTACRYALSALQLMSPKSNEKLKQKAQNILTLNFSLGDSIEQNTLKNAYFTLIDIFSIENNQDEALRLVREARIKFVKENSLLPLEINLCLKTNRFDDALQGLEQALALEPKNIAFLLNAGSIAEQIGQAERAAKYYKRAIDENPNSFEAIYGLGLYYYNQGIVIKIETDKMDVQQFKTQGQEILNNAKVQFRQALPYFERANTLRKNDNQVLQGLLTIYRFTDKLPEALTLFEKVATEKPDDIMTLQSLALIYQDLKRNKDAEKIKDKIKALEK